MKLYGTLISPFTRKAMVIAHELGLKLELAPRPSDADAFRRINPLGKVPALALNDGSVLFDSPVICEYLNHVGGGKFFPGASVWRPNTGRWKSAVLQALGDGLADAAVARVVESRRAAPDDSQIAHHLRAVETAMDALENITFAKDPTIGEISVACALGYVEFRLPDLDWKAARPKLAGWYARFCDYPSMKATQPA